MNRIIIIGNGFDLAHGLKTSYNDFFNYLKESIVQPEKSYGSYKPVPGPNGQLSNRNRDLYNRINTDGSIDEYIGVIHYPSQARFELDVLPKITSYYFESLFKNRKQLGYWSDLESHYFKLLYDHKTDKTKVELINKEFEHLKFLLQEYLTLKVESKIDLEEAKNKPEGSRIFRILDSLEKK